MMTKTHALNGNAFANFGALAALPARIADTVKVWGERADMRRELAELSFRDIQDIGLDQAMIEQEIAKPFWRA